MSILQLSQLARLVNGALVGTDREFDGVSTDSRTLAGGELFVALHGATFDGHDYLAVASERGAAAAMVDRDVQAELPYVRVGDTLRGLGELGRQWRLRC